MGVNMLPKNAREEVVRAWSNYGSILGPPGCKYEVLPLGGEVLPAADELMLLFSVWSIAQRN